MLWEKSESRKVEKGKRGLGMGAGSNFEQVGVVGKPLMEMNIKPSNDEGQNFQQREQLVRRL